MDADGLRTKYERIHFKESDTNKGKLKQGYAKWLEKELIEQLNLHLVIKCDCGNTLAKPISLTEYECVNCGKDC